MVLSKTKPMYGYSDELYMRRIKDLRKNLKIWLLEKFRKLTQVSASNISQFDTPSKELAGASTHWGRVEELKANIK